MNYELRKYIGIGLALLLLSACSQSDALLPDDGTGVLSLSSVSMADSMVSRASVQKIEEISVYTTDATANTPYASNSLAVYKYSGGSWSAASEKAPIIDANVKVYGFYPSGSSVTNSTSGDHTIPVTVKQTDTFDGTLADYLYATPVTANSANHSVSLTMNHVLSKVSFKVKKSSAATEKLVLTKIELLSPTNRLQTGDGKMNLSTGVLNSLVSTSSVVLNGSVTLETKQTTPNISCLLAPMNGQESVLSFKLTVQVGTETEARTFITKAMAPVQWKSGNHYVYAISVDKMSASLTGISVDKWKTDANQTTSIGI